LSESSASLLNSLCRVGDAGFEVGDAAVLEAQVGAGGLEAFVKGAVVVGELADALLEGGVLGGDPLDGFLGPFGFQVAYLTEKFADAGALGEDLDSVGAAFALAAAALWAVYIVFSACTGRRFPQADGLALAMVVGALLFLPWGVAESGGKVIDLVTLALGAGVALFSSVLPYTLELLALRRLPASTFAVLMGLEPVIAASAGFLVLGQVLSAGQSAAIGLVVAAGMGAVRTRVGWGEAPATAGVWERGAVALSARRQPSRPFD
jgi:hypothetical protein